MRRTIKSLAMALLMIFMVAGCTGHLKPISGIVKKPAVVQTAPSAVQMLRSVVRITGGGTGVVVAKTGNQTLILTAWHVVKKFVGPAQINGKEITFPKMKRIPVKVVMMDDLGNVVLRKSYSGDIDTNSLNNDLALIKVKARLPSAVALVARRLPRFGDVAWVIGHPFGRYEYTITKGIVSHPQQRIKQGLFSYKTYMQISSGVVPGNSGGPVFNHNGRVSGIVVGVFRMGFSMVPHLGFAVPLSHVKAFLDGSSAMKKLKAPKPKPKLKPQPKKKQVEKNGKKSN